MQQQCNKHSLEETLVNARVASLKYISKEKLFVYLFDRGSRISFDTTTEQRVENAIKYLRIVFENETLAAKELTLAYKQAGQITFSQILEEKKLPENHAKRLMSEDIIKELPIE